ncbi:type II secretion system protein GspL [Gammaproteobacteria bacterium]|nr:type II secretion system protein GspL [Gammaproteobacteria bacterium]
MSETLFFRFSGQEIEWVVLGQDGRRLEEGLSGVDLFNSRFPATYAGSIVFVVPGEKILMTTASVPSKQKRKIAQAIPFVVEEQLAAEIEESFFAIGERNKKGEVKVSIIYEQLLESLLADLDQLDLRPKKMISETSLAKSKDDAVALIEEDKAHLMRPDGCGITLRKDNVAAAISMSEPSSSLQLTGSSSSLESLAIPIAEVRANDVNVFEHQVEFMGFSQLCSYFDGSETNMLQGKYKVEEPMPEISKEWRQVLIVLGVGVILHLGLVLGQGWHLAKEKDVNRDLARELYEDIFSGEKNVRDIRRRWNLKLGRKDNDTGNDFLGLFSRAAVGVETSGLMLQNINYNESRGDLIFQVFASSSESLVQYSEKLKLEGLSVEIGAISQDADFVRGTVRISHGKDLR